MQAAFQAIRKEAEANGLKMTDCSAGRGDERGPPRTGPNAKDAAKRSPA